ncbi:integrase [Streptomyces griseochromogenes]|uniref:Integrase n=1 Tax=Streptomyces griseochromogenes TaxID=68214 RepID=A0ABS4M8V8_9ACTN|nr:hypothetical protein [Streptomyces griseochromogenes]MBP2056108.1 integrase [Streptomyces griseochromogenes]
MERWAEHWSQLREITHEDVTDAVTGLRGSQYTSVLTALRSLFLYGKKYKRVFTNPMRGIRVGRRPPGPVMPMSEDEIAHVQTTVQTPAARLAVALAAVHAVRGEVIRALQLDDLDFQQNRITLDGNTQPMGSLTRAALRAWLGERHTRWPEPSTAMFRYPGRPRSAPTRSARTSSDTSSRSTASAWTASAPTASWAKPSPPELTPLHLAAIVDISETTAVRYATLAHQLLKEDALGNEQHPA